MRIVRILMVLTTLFFTSCESEPEKALPSVLLSEAQMVDVMVDVQLMESSISVRKSSNHQTAYLRTHGFDTIFSHHGITDSVFTENFRYYSEDPDVMLRIMDSVVVELNRMKADLENDQTQSSPSPDQ